MLKNDYKLKPFLKSFTLPPYLELEGSSSLLPHRAIWSLLKETLIYPQITKVLVI